MIKNLLRVGIIFGLLFLGMLLLGILLQTKEEADWLTLTPTAVRKKVTPTPREKAGTPWQGFSSGEGMLVPAGLKEEE